MAKEKLLSRSDLNDMVPKLDQFVSSLKPSQQKALARPFAATAKPKSQQAIQQFLDAKVGNLNPHTRSIVAGVAAGVAGGVATGVASKGGRGTTAGVAAGVAGGSTKGGRGTSAGVAAGVAGGGGGTTAGVAVSQNPKGSAKKK